MRPNATKVLRHARELIAIEAQSDPPLTRSEIGAHSGAALEVQRPTQPRNDAVRRLHAKTKPTLLRFRSIAHKRNYGKQPIVFKRISQNANPFKKGLSSRIPPLLPPPAEPPGALVSPRHTSSRTSRPPFSALTLRTMKLMRAALGLRRSKSRSLADLMLCPMCELPTRQSLRRMTEGECCAGPRWQCRHRSRVRRHR